MTSVFHTNRMFSMNILFGFRIEQIKAFLIVIEEKRFYNNLAGLVIYDRSTMLEFTDINTDVNHGITPFKNISDEYQYRRFKSIREYGSKCELTSIKEGLI